MNAPNLLEHICTLRAVRKFKPDPVGDEEVNRILKAAVAAPNAGNAQPWRFIVVRESPMKLKLREIALAAWEKLMRYITVPPQAGKMYNEGRLMVENTDRTPLLLLVFGDPTPYLEQAKGLARLALKAGAPQAWKQLNLNLSASIYPAVQNILLAAKSLGLGACLTTSITLMEAEVKRLLAVPKPFKLYALIYLGYPALELKPPGRRPVEDVTRFERWSEVR